MTNTMIVYDFDGSSDISSWKAVNDVVMGGKSQGKISVDPGGHGVFEGVVSLENGGGFSLARHGLEQIETVGYQKFVIKLKGDGKRYQFRVKSEKSDYYSYVAYFYTAGDWEVVEIPFSSMYPRFRGRNLDFSYYPGQTLEEIGFLIGNGTQEAFKLIIDSVSLK